MTGFEKLAALENRIAIVLKKAETEAAKTETEISGSRAALEAAKTHQEAAVAASDPKAFRAARVEEENAAEAIQFSERRLSSLRDRQLISEDEYKQLLADVYAEGLAYIDQESAEIAQVFKTLLDRADRIEEFSERVDKAVRMLDTRVMRRKVPAGEASYPSSGAAFFKIHIPGSGLREGRRNPAEDIRQTLNGIIPAFYLKQEGR